MVPAEAAKAVTEVAAVIEAGNLFRVNVVAYLGPLRRSVSEASMQVVGKS